MEYNYQIMKEKSENGNYIPNMEELKNNASCQEEIEYLNSVEAYWKEYAETGYPELIGFTFNMCYVMRQACGHFEIFQVNVQSEEEAINWLRLMENESATRKCTRCLL